MTIEFSYNWNNKLSCHAHTTLRLRNDSKYIIGQTYEETLKGRKLQDVTIVDIKYFTLNRLNNYIAFLDTGYDVLRCAEIIKTMYKKGNVNWETQELSLILLVVDKNTIEVPQAQNDKIAMFCNGYKEITGLSYKVSRADAGKIKELPLELPLLNHYFRSENFLFKGKWSIANLAKYYNELRADMAGASKFPNFHDPKLEKKLEGEQLMKYHQHLKSIGWTQNYSQGGGQTWKKPTQK